MAEEMLRIEDLWVEYKTDDGIFHAVNGLNLTLCKGENLGLVGETGAGKTTTALSVMRLLPSGVGTITKGRIIFDGQDMLELPEKEMRKLRGNLISMVFQDPMTSLNPVLSVGEQVAEVLRLHNPLKKPAEIEERVDELFLLVGIAPERKGEYPHQFSGGMKQRIVIALAIACQPELLLADEPTTALDVTVQAQVLAMMEELREKLNTSMILITHDLGIVAQMCEKVAIVYAGQVVESGTLQDIFDRPPHHPYTDGLFDSIPQLNKKTDRLHVIGGLVPDSDNLPEGCKFHPRCEKCMEICKTKEPVEHWRDGHMIRCHLYNTEKEVL